MADEEESYHEWARRTYTEAADAQGLANGFLVWCLINQTEVLEEFMEYDRQMKATGLYVRVGD